jgi:hypothetical protein
MRITAATAVKKAGPSNRFVRVGELIGYGLLLGLLGLCVYSFVSDSLVEAEYSGLVKQVEALEVKRLSTLSSDRNADTSKLDSQIAELKPKLAKLEPRHQALEAQRDKALEESQRQKAVALERQFQKRCETLRSKRIADLTLNDVDGLKQCGIDPPRLP